MITTFKRYLKEQTNNFLTDPVEIKAWLMDHFVHEEAWSGKKIYTIRQDGTVDVEDSIGLSSLGLERLPIRFGKCNGDFFIHDNNLKSLEGCPYYVGGRFQAHSNQWLSSYEHLPEIILDQCALGLDNVKSLAGIDWSKHTIRSLYLDTNDIKKGGIGLLHIKNTIGPKKLKDRSALNGGDRISDPFKIIAKYYNNPDDFFECQAALIDNGFEEFAQL